MAGSCSFSGCERNHKALGYCGFHYKQHWQGKELTQPGVKRSRMVDEATRAQLFWSKVEKTDGCWIWTAGTINGYGQFGIGWPKTMLAHRWSYENAHGPIPEGMQIDHVCRVRSCVRPDHLRVVTNKQNHENMVGHKGSQTGIRGVYYDKLRGYYYIQVTHNGQRHFGKTYRGLDEANAAAIALRNSLFTHNDTDHRAAS